MGAPANETATSPSRRRGRRLIAWAAVVLLGLPLLAAALGWLALHSAGVRRSLLARISRSYEASTGIRAHAADFSLKLRPGVLVLDDVTLAAGDATPFLTSESVRVEFDWGGLFGEPTTLRALVLERPVADLRQPLPPVSDEPFFIDIHELRLADGRLLGEVAPPAEGEPWLTAYDAEGVDVAGSYLESRAELRLAPARLTLVRAAGEPLVLVVASRLGGPLEGPYRIDDLKLTGDGLRLDAAGELGTGDDEPLFLRLELEADPALLVSELEPGARVKARGEIDLRTFRGQLEVAASDFPSAALEPWIGEAARPGGRPSYLDLDARFAGDPAAARQVSGDGTLTWRQEDRRLAEASFTLTDGRLDDAGIVLDSLVGDVHAVARDLPAELLRPFVDAELLARFAVRGTRFDLTADVTVDAAAPAEPTGAVDLTWRRGREELLVTSARTVPSARTSTVDGPGPALAVAFEATLLPATPGRRHLAGSLAAASWPELAAGELRATRLELELPDVAAAVADARERWPLLLEGFDPATLPVALAGAVTAAAEVAGTFDAPRVTLDATWRPDDASTVAVTAAGEPLARRGEARLELAAYDLARLPGDMHGLLDGTVTARGEPTDWSAEIDLRGTDLRYGSAMPVFERLRLEADTDGKSLRIATLSGRTGESLFTGDGHLDLPQPLFGTDAAEAKIARGALYLDAEKPFSGIDRLAFRAELTDGVVHVKRLDVETPNGPGELAAEIPLGALRAFEIDVDAWPVVVADGRIMVDLGFPRIDLGDLALDVGQEPPWTTHQASLTGRVWIEPGDLTAAEGELLVERWLLEVEDHRIEVTDDPILIALAGHKLEVLPVTLSADGRPVDVRATVDLTPGWSPEDGFAALVAAIDAHAKGVVEGGLFTPYLAGGVADGPVAVTADVTGTLDDLDIHVVADGPDARMLYMTPYVTQLEAFHVELIVDGDEIRLPEARARLNGGTLRLDARRSAAGDWTFNARFDDVRYRVDYGLSAQLDGRLDLALPAEGQGRLAGEVVVERGVLRRDVDLQREILSVLNAPPDVAGARTDPLDAIELDLVITTAEGVRIKNNLADLKADWSTITVQGTLANPVIEGRIEAAAGGRVAIFGRTAPSDQVALIFTGDPGAPTELELPTLTAFQATQDRDPSAPRGPFEWQDTVEYEQFLGGGGGDPAAKEKQLGLGLASYYGGQIAERISERLGTVRVQPVLVFGESDPAAKIVVSNDLSRHVALAAAIDLRDSQNQTYLLDLHDFRGLPRFTFQAFTNDAGNQGGTFQHTLLFGGGKRDESQIRLRKIRVEGLPEELSARRVRNAVGYTRNEPLPAGVAFDVEVDVAEQLRQRGFPDAEVEVQVAPVKPELADLIVKVDPGRHVVFEFEGDTPPVGLRRSITASYRTDFYEPAALAEIREQTVQALRGLGYLDPVVTVVVEPATADVSRVVRIRGEGGRRVRIGRVAFAGVDDADAALLRGRLGGEAARVELAAGLPEADEWLLTQMRSLGYPEAEIVSRRLADDGRELAVTLAPGPRQELASVAITGLNDDDRGRYEQRLPLAPGDVPRSDRVSAGKYLIQNDLKRQGHAEARVRPVLSPADEGRPRLLDLVYEVDPGPLYRLDELKIEGLQATRPRWAAKVTRLEEDAPLEPARVAEARRRLLGTRLFTSVRSTSERFPETSTAIVTFDVEEIPRYQLAYGVRWESSEGASVVVDAVDRNFLGGGTTLGMRGLYSQDDQAGRFYVAKTGLFGRRMALEYYLEQRHVEEDLTPEDPVPNVIITDSTESSIQVSFPIRRLTSRVYARFRREEIREKDPGPITFPQTIRFPFVGWQVIYDTRDDLINPRRGRFVSADLSTTNDAIGSDFDFVRLFTQLHWHRPAFRLGRRQLIWSQAYRLGLLTSQDQLPLSQELFRAGGEYSVRGYPTDSLADATRGGEALLVINQELRFPIRSLLSGVVFVDAGNAWGDKGDFGSDLLLGTGFGLRADTPFGLFRLDLARPLDRRESDPQYKVYVGFGHAF